MKHDQRLYAYPLHEFEATARTDALEEHLRSAGVLFGDGTTLECSANGAFRYFDHHRLGDNKRPDEVAKTPRAAVIASRRFMAAVNQAAARWRGSRGLSGRDYPAPFPLEALRLGEVRPQKAATRPGTDHWFVDWTTWLTPAPLTYERPTLVLGASIDVRVGAQNRIVAIVSRVRPWKRPVLCRGLEWSSSPHHPPRVVYLSDEPTEPQRYLAPYYIDDDDNGSHADEHGESSESGMAGHHRRSLWPACNLTLLPEVQLRFVNRRVEVSAVVLGGSRSVHDVSTMRHLRARWRISRLHSLSNDSETYVGPAVSFSGPGPFHVELAVEDLRTGAIRTTHVIVPSRPPTSERSRS